VDRSIGQAIQLISAHCPSVSPASVERTREETSAKWHAALSIKWILLIAEFRKTLYLKLQQTFFYG
jgi:hypothetical protein